MPALRVQPPEVNMLSTRYLIPLMLAPALALAIEPRSEGNGVREDFHFSYTMQPGGSLSVNNFNGPVEIAGWDQNSIDISGTKHAATQELLNAIKIESSVTGGRAVVRSVRPEATRGNMGVRYVIKVPRRTTLEDVTSSNGGLRVTDIEGNSKLRSSNGPVRALRVKGALDATTSNGGVEAEDIDGNAVVRTSNGPVRVQRVRGNFEATTSNGPVQADLSESKTSQPVLLTTSNGPVNLRLGASANPGVHATTSNGPIDLAMPAGAGATVKAVTSSHSRVTSDFDVQRQNAETRSRFEGQIGAGGPLIELTTSNGPIHLRKM
jgi:hypothetical protein